MSCHQVGAQGSYPGAVPGTRGGNRQATAAQKVNAGRNSPAESWNSGRPETWGFQQAKPLETTPEAKGAAPFVVSADRPETRGRDVVSRMVRRNGARQDF